MPCWVRSSARVSPAARPQDAAWTQTAESDSFRTAQMVVPALLNRSGFGRQRVTVTVTVAGLFGLLSSVDESVSGTIGSCGKHIGFFGVLRWVDMSSTPS